MSDDVEVYLRSGSADVLVGRLYSHRRRGVEASSFGYDPSYLSWPGAYALDPGLPLLAGTQHTPAGMALFGAFRDSSPDRWGRTLISRAEGIRARSRAESARSLAEVDFLLGVRDDLRQGALRFRRGADSPFLATERDGVPRLAELGELLDVATRVENDTAEYDELRRLIRAGSSLGGARPKAHVRDTSGRIAIAKFPSGHNDTWNVMAWEKVALDLAAAGGITVPNSRLVKVADRHVLIVDRFDRDLTGDRIGYASAMSMLEASDGDQRSYLEIAEVIETTSASAASDLIELWRRMAFNVLISNTDDHLRNHGFLHVQRDTWGLAPAFDLNPNPQPGAAFLSTAIDESDTEASVDLLLSVAGWFRLNPSRALMVLAQVSAAVDTWTDVAARHGLPAADRDAMRPAFERDALRRARMRLG